jgi:hypothetical protein
LDGIQPCPVAARVRSILTRIGPMSAIGAAHFPLMFTEACDGAESTDIIAGRNFGCDVPFCPEMEMLLHDHRECLLCAW